MNSMNQHFSEFFYRLITQRQCFVCTVFRFTLVEQNGSGRSFFVFPRVKNEFDFFFFFKSQSFQVVKTDNRFQLESVDRSPLFLGLYSQLVLIFLHILFLLKKVKTFHELLVFKRYPRVFRQKYLSLFQAAKQLSFEHDFVLRLQYELLSLHLLFNLLGEQQISQINVFLFVVLDKLQIILAIKIQVYFSHLSFIDALRESIIFKRWIHSLLFKSFERILIVITFFIRV